jgi:DNA-binding response OmpR family regulator
MKKTDKIHIIESNLEHLDFIENTIRDLYPYQVTNHGQKALDLATTYQPNAILLEGILDGLILCRLIRKNPLFAKTKIVIVTEGISLTDKIKGFQAGADGFFCKPFSAKELLLTLEDLLTNQCFIDGLITQKREAELLCNLH